MLQAIRDVAPLQSWAILMVAASFLLTGFVLLSHTLVRSKAYGDGYQGPTHPGRFEWTLRVGAGCLAVGAGLWAWELGAPLWLLLALALTALVAFGLEAVALRRR